MRIYSASSLSFLLYERRALGLGAQPDSLKSACNIRYLGLTKHTYMPRVTRRVHVPSLLPRWPAPWRLSFVTYIMAPSPPQVAKDVDVRHIMALAVANPQLAGRLLVELARQQQQQAGESGPVGRLNAVMTNRHLT